MNDFIALQNAEYIEIIDNLKKKVHKIFFDRLEEARKAGEIRKDINKEFVLYLMNDLYKKIEDPLLLPMFKDYQSMVIALTEHFFYGLINTGNRHTLQINKQT